MSEGLSALCVYCGSSGAPASSFTSAAAKLGRMLATSGVDLVYGGASVGLMGVLADATLEAGGSVHGVITSALVGREIAHTGLSTLTVVETMHERKAAMADRADAFAMLPGGFGTLDEFFEALTWAQLGIHAKPCGILNVDGYFDPLVSLFERAAASQLLRREHKEMVIVEREPQALLDALRQSSPVTVDKWVGRAGR